MRLSIVTRYSFPDDFMIGTSTSSFQIETPVDHQLKGLIGKDGSKLISTIAHEQRRSEDARHIARLGDAYRFSLDWGRLQRYPYEPFQTDVVKEYRSFMEKLHQSGVKLHLVLHHFANPNWFENLGAWLSHESSEIYLDYVRQVKRHFGDLISNYDTFNEPGVYATFSYLSGFFPPYKKMRVISAEKVIRNMAYASDQAYDMLKRRNGKCNVGFAKSVLKPLPISLLGNVSAFMYKRHFIGSIMRTFKKKDYLGLNYYGEMPMGLMPLPRPNDKKKFDSLGLEHDDLWVYDPGDLKNIILSLQKKHGKPIIITENGYCGSDDKRRSRFIEEHLKSVHSAISEGADVRGYFYWSTFDNFELFLGRTYRFGLVDIDYSSMRRKPKPSARFYQKLVKEKSFECHDNLRHH